MISMRKFVNTFFTFTDVELSPDCVKDWESVGFNIGSTYTFDPQKHRLENLRKILRRCEAAEIQLLISDKRVSYKALETLGEPQFRENVKAALKDYGESAAFLGFFMGDEPHANQYEYVIRANRIVLEYTDKTNFVNFLPYFAKETSRQILGCDPEAYADKLCEIVRDGGYKIWGMDHYGIMWLHEKERGHKLYYKSLHICAETMRRTGTDCWWAGLCIGHWNTGQPDITDMRWQQSIALMLGLKGINWYKFYDTRWGMTALLNGCGTSFPINFLGDKTQTFYDIRMVTQLYNHKFSERFNALSYETSWQYLADFTGLMQFEEGCDAVLRQIRSDHAVPLILSRFRDAVSGEAVYIVMNVGRTLPDVVFYEYTEDSNRISGHFWVQPGELCILE